MENIEIIAFRSDPIGFCRLEISILPAGEGLSAIVGIQGHFYYSIPLFLGPVRTAAPLSGYKID